MAPVYLDSSAILKLVLEEVEATALRDFLANWPHRLSSELARVEVGRAVKRATSPAREQRQREVLTSLYLIEVQSTVLEHAMSLPPAHLRSLDAIHLATAMSVTGLRDIVVYDRRLGEAALRAGLRVWAPGQP